MSRAAQGAIATEHSPAGEGGRHESRVSQPPPRFLHRPLSHNRTYPSLLAVHPVIVFCDVLRLRKKAGTSPGTSRYFWRDWREKPATKRQPPSGGSLAKGKLGGGVLSERRSHSLGPWCRSLSREGSIRTAPHQQKRRTREERNSTLTRSLIPGYFGRFNRHVQGAIQPLWLLP